MSNEQKPTESMGLIVVGQIMAKNHYLGRNGKSDRFTIDVAVPGLRQFINVGICAEDWAKSDIMSIFKAKVTFNLFNGRLYFQAAV